MFDLDQEITQWRRAMTAGGVDDPAVLDELESHLRDHITQQVRLGEELEYAFNTGVERVGQPSVLKREFLRADKMLRLTWLVAMVDDRRKSFWAAAILSAVVSVGFYCHNALTTPVYEGATLVQLFRRSLPTTETDPRRFISTNDIRASEDLNSLLRLITSDRLRTSVAASLTPAEQTIVRRSATPRPSSAEAQPTNNDSLGVLTVRPMRLYFVVRLSVVHRDAEAAALLANRYVQQCHAALRNMAVSERIFFRVTEAAKPSRFPIAPNLTRILLTSLGLGLVTLLGLVTMGAALRKFGQMRMKPGPQVRTS